jgi:hypothetical protein
MGSRSARETRRPTAEAPRKRAPRPSVITRSDHWLAEQGTQHDAAEAEAQGDHAQAADGEGGGRLRPSVTPPPQPGGQRRPVSELIGASAVDDHERDRDERVQRAGQDPVDEHGEQERHAGQWAARDEQLPR